MTDLALKPPELRRRVAVSTATQVVARVVHLSVNVLSTLIVIRYLAPVHYGSYVLILTISTLIGLIADFGLVKLATREVSRDLETENEVLGTVLAARIVLALACVGLLQLALFGLRASAELHLAGLFASLLYFGNALMVACVAFYVRIKQQYEAMIQVGMELGETALLILLVLHHASLPSLFLAPAIGAIGGGSVALAIAHRRFRVAPRIAFGRLRYLLSEALPLGPALLISVCYLKVDALMLIIMRTPREVGLYGSAYQPVEYVFLGAAVIVNVIFPLVAAAWAEGNRQRFAELYRRGAEVLVATMVLVPVVLSQTAVPLVTKVYGPAYRAAARPLQLLAVTLVLMTLNGWQAFVLLGGGRQRVTLLYNLGALVVAVTACAVLIHAYGIVGAAWATLCSAFFVLLCSTVAVHKYFGVTLALAPLVKIAAAAGALWVSLWVLHKIGAPWQSLIPISLVAYPIWLVAFRAVRPSAVRDILPSRAEREAAGTAVVEAAP